MNNDKHVLVRFAPYLGLHSWLDHAITFASLLYIEYFGPNNSDANDRLIRVGFHQAASREYGQMGCTISYADNGYCLNSSSGKEALLHCEPSHDYDRDMQTTFQGTVYESLQLTDPYAGAENSRGGDFEFWIKGSDLLLAHKRLLTQIESALETAHSQANQANAARENTGSPDIKGTLSRMLYEHATRTEPGSGQFTVRFNTTGRDRSLLDCKSVYYNGIASASLALPHDWLSVLKSPSVNRRYDRRFHNLAVELTQGPLHLSTHYSNRLVIDAFGISNTIAMTDFGLEVSLASSASVAVSRLRIDRWNN